MEDNKITEKIIVGTIKVQRTLGPDLLEYAQECLLFELKSIGLKVVKEIALPIGQKEIKLNHGYRIENC